MSAAHVSPVSPQEGTFARLRNSAASFFFALVRLMQRIPRIRQNPSSWFLFRTVLGITGAALVMLPLSLWNDWLTAPMGLCMFLTSILLPPAAHQPSEGAAARQLDRVLVVNGGRYRPRHAAAVRVRLFVGGDAIHALDARLQPMVTVRVREIAATQLFARKGHWVLQVSTSSQSVEFFFMGILAERRARRAHTAVAAVIPAVPLPATPRARAAGA